MDMLPFLFASRRRFGSGRSKKSKKKPKDNWFERIKADELKQICRAAKLPIKGTKKDIIARLLENDGTSEYAAEGKWIGTTVESLKAKCKERYLVQSGTKLTLVVRIVEHDHSSNPDANSTMLAAAKKRSAPSDNGDGADVDGIVAAKKKRKRAPPRPKPEKIYVKVQKKVESVRQKKYQSHWGSKSHATDVYSFIAHTIFDEEIENKGFVEKEPLFALQLAKSALTSLSDNWTTMERPGYDEDYIQCFSSSLEKIIEACISKNLIDEEMRSEHLEWIEKLDSKLEPFGLGCDYGDGDDRFLQHVADILRPRKEGETSMDKEDNKGTPLEVTTTEENKPSEHVNEKVGIKDTVDQDLKCTILEGTDRQKTEEKTNGVSTTAFNPTTSKEHKTKSDEGLKCAPTHNAHGSITLKNTTKSKDHYSDNGIKTAHVAISDEKKAGE